MKNIVICCDGTSNEFGTNNTNVVHTFMLAEKNIGQIVWYDPGVGTGGWDYCEEDGGLKAKSDQATGFGLQKNVEDAYRFLMSCWEIGDHIFLFGFSRGAFTVRSLAGMLHEVGLLPPHLGNLVEYAGKLYNTECSQAAAYDFRHAFSLPCCVHCIGVWDTVASLLMNAGKKWSDTSLPEDMLFAYQALAIDEHRIDFPPSLWDESNLRSGQTVEQVWFAGCHEDVGGGHVECGLSDIALRWMLEKASACGMQVDMNELRGVFPGLAFGPSHDSYTGFWRFRGAEAREIPAGSLVHRSVVERQTHMDYAPKNLPETFEVVD